MASSGFSGAHDVSSDPETATWSRARRRHAAVPRQVEGALNAKIDLVGTRMEVLIKMIQDLRQSSVFCGRGPHQLQHRGERMEAFFVCTSPSVDEVLEDMLQRRRGKPELKAEGA